MLPKPHGGKLVNRVLEGGERNRVLRELPRLPRLELSSEQASDLVNIATGVFSPLEGFMGEEDFQMVLYHKRLANGLPWTIPIVLDVAEKEAASLGRGDRVALWYRGKPLGVLDIAEIYEYDKEDYARQVFGTLDTAHPGVRKVLGMKERLLAGEIWLLEVPEGPFPQYYLTPKETRVLFEARDWRTVVGFQTRNVPHLGHEYVQKTALTFVDGIFINPVLGRKKPGDFKDEVIIKAYEALLKNYYLKERVVFAVLRTEMRYAGPREAIFHAIVRKNFGCTHFIVGRDHAGVGNFYPPYAAQEIFDEFPDLGIVPLFFRAFFYCRKCGGVVNEKICPHGESERINFSGTALRRLLRGEPLTGLDLGNLIRPEVAAVVSDFDQPFVS